ncbi:MAG: DMT family transporter [Candidatus Pacebacteria bacterium]|nr:DMT family transporter [Candidatus Paceibacterota bacterium]
MSNWFLIALIAPILWSIVNHIDKYMLSKYLKDRGVGALLIFSALASVVILPFIAYFYHNEIFSISINDFWMLILIGLLSAGAFFFYLKGMDAEEATIVIPLFQLVPVFGYFLGYFILKETLSTQQIFSSLLIISGIVILALEIDTDNKVTLKTKVLAMVSISSFLFALHDTLFKKVAIVESFWVSVFWQYASLTIFGILALIFIRKFRNDFLSMFKNIGGKVLSLNIVSELLYIFGNLTNNFATLMAPVAVVLVVSSYQPLFVFIGGVFLTIFLPHISMEKISAKHLIHKIISIIIIIIGSYFLYASSNY